MEIPPQSFDKVFGERAKEQEKLAEQNRQLHDYDARLTAAIDQVGDLFEDVGVNHKSVTSSKTSSTTLKHSNLIELPIDACQTEHEAEFETLFLQVYKEESQQFEIRKPLRRITSRFRNPLPINRPTARLGGQIRTISFGAMLLGRSSIGELEVVEKFENPPPLQRYKGTGDIEYPHYRKGANWQEFTANERSLAELEETLLIAQLALGLELPTGSMPTAKPQLV